MIDSRAQNDGGHGEQILKCWPYLSFRVHQERLRKGTEISQGTGRAGEQGIDGCE